MIDYRGCPCFNLRPAGPSPTPTFCWRAVTPPPPPSLSVTNGSDGKNQTAIESPGQDLSDKVEKVNPGVTCDVTGQVKHNM